MGFCPLTLPERAAGAIRRCVKPKHFEQLVEMTESERMFMFSTDYPHYDADSVDRVLPGILPEGLRQRIRYQNALDTYPRLKSLGQ